MVVCYAFALREQRTHGSITPRCFIQATQLPFDYFCAFSLELIPQDSPFVMSEGSGVALDFFAGCVAGTLSILACHPLDTIRIRLQSGQFSTISECVKSSLKNEGALGLYKGLVPPLVGVSLINASLFGMKAVTTGVLESMDDKSAAAAVGAGAGVASAAAASSAAGTASAGEAAAGQQASSTSDQPNFKHLMISGATGVAFLSNVL